MRVGIIALLHESNTFISQPTTLEHFQQNLLATGDEVRERLFGSHHEVGGFFDELDAFGAAAVPIFAARALPFGAIEAGAFDRLLDMMLEQLDSAGKLDGLLVAPHGATVSQSHPDADGRWLSLVRRQVGDGAPIIGTLDPHANLSQQMVDATDALVAYRTNPHLDQRQRGQEAARLMVRTLKGEIRPTQAAAMPAMSIDIECQDTNEPPCRPLYDLADAMLNAPGVLSNSIFLGFPYADVPEFGSAALVVTDNDRPLAQRCAGEIASSLWERRGEFVGRHISPTEAVDKAMELSQGGEAVCLLDMGDNVGGGSPGDGTVLAKELGDRGVGDCFVCLADAEAVCLAEQADVGSRISLRLGGKTDQLHGPPLEGEFEVIRICDGKFEEPRPRHGGMGRFDQGRTAVVRSTSGMTVMLSSRRMVPFSLRQLECGGLDPQSFRILVAKGVNAPIAAYRETCSHFLKVDTPGVTRAKMTELEYQHRRRPMFPFERD